MLLWIHRSIIYVGIEDFYKIPVDHYIIYISDRRYILFLYINQDIYRMMEEKLIKKDTFSLNLKNFQELNYNNYK